jgi:hypothetical protein
MKEKVRVFHINWRDGDYGSFIGPVVPKEDYDTLNDELKRQVKINKQIALTIDKQRQVINDLEKRINEHIQKY